MRKILVGYDGSEPSHRALEYAATLADGGVVTVASVVPNIAGVPYAGMPDPFAEETADRLLTEAKTFLKEHDVSAATIEPVGDAAEKLIRAAEHEGIQLIIVGTRGQNALERLLAGSVSTRLVRDAPCDVLVVR
jgi:nucleotide-binding universal stress UspA family protein